MIGAFGQKQKILNISGTDLDYFELCLDRIDEKFMDWFINKINKTCELFLGATIRSDLKYIISSEFSLLKRMVNELGLFNIDFKIDINNNVVVLKLFINGKRYNINDLIDIKESFEIFKYNSDDFYKEYSPTVMFYNFKNDMSSNRDDAFIQFDRFTESG